MAVLITSTLELAAMTYSMTPSVLEVSAHRSTRKRPARRLMVSHPHSRRLELWPGVSTPKALGSMPSTPRDKNRGMKGYKSFLITSTQTGRQVGG